LGAPFGSNLLNQSIFIMPPPGHLTRRLFAAMLRKIAALPSPAG
jgi:hypothetical protein